MLFMTSFYDEDCSGVDFGIRRHKGNNISATKTDCQFYLSLFSSSFWEETPVEELWKTIHARRKEKRRRKKTRGSAAAAAADVFRSMNKRSLGIFERSLND